MLENSLGFNLEPTFRCNLGCEMCPRFSSEDPQLDMTMETYGRIHEAMVFAHTVDFTGWGEPMLHPHIYQMVGMARDQGCATTMTSNGTILNERNAARLIESGMQNLTISIDGLKPETFDAIRVGASFTKVTENLCSLTRIARQTNAPLQLGIAFTIQEQNAEELHLIVPWLVKIGAGTLHLKQLNVVSNREDWQRSFLKYAVSPGSQGASTQGTARLRQLESQVLAVRQEAEKAGIRVLIHSELPLTHKRQGRHCLAAPLNAVYFSYDGRVAPCCHFGHHVSRYFDGEYHPPSSLFYGNIQSQELTEIWNDPEFRSFRQGFRDQKFPKECQTCYLLYGK
jgi:radical SAM protein with 4Fe4S-binding SPASM domain